MLKLRNKKKSEKGITLIALVISIIVMLILAGVSLNATVGENGILTQAQEAAKAQKKASELEALQMAVVNHSAKAFLDEDASIDALVEDLMNQGLIDWIDTLKDDSGNSIDYNKYEDENGHKYIWVKKGDNSYRIFLDENGTYSVDEMPLSGGGTLIGGTHMVTKDAFESGEGITDPNEKGKFTIEGDTKVIFNEPLGVKDDGITASGDMLSIYVKSGANVKIYFNANKDKKAADGITYYVLTNMGLSRAAIDIEPGGSLTLYIGDKVNVLVDSGYGGLSAPATSWNFVREEGVIGGNGAFAGIHVPKYDVETTIKRVELNEDGTIKRDAAGKAIYTSRSYPVGSATLNIMGKGTLIAKGGDAGDGGDGGRNNLDWAAGAGGGAGAGIGGNGGNGAVGTAYPTPGDKGEDCGNINISNSAVIYAYGGSGGSGGGLTINRTPSGAIDVQSGAGGGGFPAAGIGGGGAGGGTGSTNCSGGGFGNGQGEYTSATIGGVNGESLHSQNTGSPIIGGAYYESYANTPEAKDNILSVSNTIPTTFTNTTDEKYKYLVGTTSGKSAGIGGQLYDGKFGGKAGKGGTIKVSENATVNAYNGSYITTRDSSEMTDSERQTTQALIYAQAGFDVKAIIGLKTVKVVNGRTIAALNSEWSSFSAHKTITSPYTNGINIGKFILGIGSGCGGQQDNDGNGTYTVDASLN